jgi:iron complex outermembrane receptor protein
MRITCLLCCIALTVVSSVRAESDSVDLSASDVDELSLGDLMEVEVSSVSRKSHQLANTAAAAFIISQEDIRRSGATSIPEALRLAPGVEVAQISSSRWAVSIRGFNGQYANKLLVLMDGRTLYTPLFSGVFWDQQDTMMEDVERIEVIRGPGAVMWGSNAVNGVINIISKKAKDTQGNLFAAGGGNQEQGFVGYRYGGQLDNDSSYRVYAKAFEREAYQTRQNTSAADDWRSAQSGFRYDHRISNDNHLTVQGDVYRLKKGCSSQPYTLSPPFNVAFSQDCYGDGANILSKWETAFSNGSELNVQAYYDRVGFTSVATANVQDTFDIDMQHRLPAISDHELMWGINYRFVHSVSDNTDVFQYHPSDLSFHQGGFFVQDDVFLVKDRLRLTLGGKIEESHFGHTQLQPNARLLWTPDSQNSVWISMSRASRIPSQGASTADVAAATTSTTVSSPFGRLSVPVQVLIMANPDLKAEKVFSSEIGYRSQWNSRFFTDITAFSNQYTDQIVLSRGPSELQIAPRLQASQQLLWGNQSQNVTTRGVELAADWQALDWMRFSGSYTYLSIENDSAVGNSPRNHGSLRWQIDMTENTQFDTTVRHVSRLSGGDVPAYTAFDMRLAYRPIKGMEWAVVAQNLFAPQHVEFNDSPLSSSTEYAITVPRSIYGKLVWEF